MLIFEITAVLFVPAFALSNRTVAVTVKLSFPITPESV